VQQLLPILMIIGFAVIAGVGIYFGHIQAKKRREAMALLANELGMSFNPARDSDHDDHYAHFEIFRRGDNRTAYNTLFGERTVNAIRLVVKAGDFRYTVTTGSGKDRKTTTYNFSYLIVHLPYPTMPDLLIRPEHVFDRIAGVFSNKDIDFESEEFSRRFMVASPDRKFAYDICHPCMIEFLLETRPPAVDIERARLCLADGSRTWTPEQFRWMLQFADTFLGHWPDHVVKDLTHTT